MKNVQLRTLLLVAVLSLGMWLAFAQLVVPSVIESAYRGESLAVLNHLIRGQHAHPVTHYLSLWKRIAVAVFLVGSGSWLMVLVALWERRAGRAIVEGATPGALGATRMWTCLVLLLAVSLEDLASIAALPPEVRQHIGVMHYAFELPGFEAFVRNAAALRSFQWLTQLLLFLGVLGLWTRVVIPLGALCHLVLLGLLVDYSFFWHQNLVPLYFLAVLSFTPCGDGWSLDRLLRISRGRPVPDANRTAPVYSWSRYACWVVLALPYVENGLAKLRDGGLFWWNPTNMRWILYYDTLTPREFDWDVSLRLATAPDIVFAVLGLSALAAELSYGLVLVSPTARRILPVVAILMHVSILILQRILFIDLILLQAIFFDWTTVRTAIGRRLARARGHVDVFYDGRCALCRRTVGILSGVDLFRRLAFYDFRRLDPARYGAARRLGLDPMEFEKAMCVVSPAGVSRGFYAFRTIALSVPALWPTVPWLFGPGLSSLGERIYRRIARERFGLVCEEHCAEAPAETTPIDTAVRAMRDGGRPGYPVAVAGIVATSLLCWFYRVEFYPLTAWHLYNFSDTSGTVEYLKVAAKYESGVVDRARIEDAIGAMRFDGRYSRAIQKCFGSDSDLEVCRTFLTAAGRAYNAKTPRARRIDEYRIQKWAWNFRSSPADPAHGRLVDQRVIKVGER